MNVSKKLEETMNTRTPAPTEMYENKTDTCIIPNYNPQAESMSSNDSNNDNVTMSPLLPVKKNALKIIDLSLFEKLQVDFSVCDDAPLFSNLNAFIASAPKTPPYRIKVTKKEAYISGKIPNLGSVNVGCQLFPPIKSIMLICLKMGIPL